MPDYFGTDRTEYKFPHAEHLSPSSIGDYLRCPCCFYWSRVLKTPYPMSVNLPIGGSVHKGIEAARKALIAKPDAVLDGESFVETAAQHFDKSLEVDEETGTEIQLDLGRNYTTAGAAKDAVVNFTRYALARTVELDVKRGIIAAELDLSEFDNPWPFPMKGIVDALYGPDPEHCSAGADLKTSSKQQAPDFFAALQLGIYREYFPVAWFADVLAKTAKPSFQTYFMTEQGQDFVRSTVMDVAERISKGDFPARPSFYCKFEHGGPTFRVAVEGYEAA